MYVCTLTAPKLLTVGETLVNINYLYLTHTLYPSFKILKLSFFSIEIVYTDYTSRYIPYTVTPKPKIVEAASIFRTTATRKMVSPTRRWLRSPHDTTDD